MHQLASLLLGALHGCWVGVYRRPQVQRWQGIDCQHHWILLLLLQQLLLECHLHCKHA
jgi:hypothetical protein